MKKVLLLFTGLVILIACTKKEAPFEIFSEEAFAYDLGSSWEVNSQVRIKGFTQLEKDGIYTASIKFTVDLIKPNGEKVTDIFEDEKSETKNEVIMDLPLEAQFELDSTYPDGNYTLIFTVQDNNSDSRASKEIKFELSR